MVLAAYYIPPGKVDEAFLSMAYDKLTSLKTKYKNSIHIIGGDFNLPDID